MSSFENCLFKNVHFWCKKGIGRVFLHPYFYVQGISYGIIIQTHDSRMLLPAATPTLTSFKRHHRFTPWLGPESRRPDSSTPSEIADQEVNKKKDSFA